MLNIFFLNGKRFHFENSLKSNFSLCVNRPAQSVKLAIAIAIFFTYALQFYVPMEIIWKNVRGYFPESKKNLAEYGIRAILVIGTVATTVAIPNIGPFISLIGKCFHSIYAQRIR